MSDCTYGSSAGVIFLLGGNDVQFTQRAAAVLPGDCVRVSLCLRLNQQSGKLISGILIQRGEPKDREV